MSLPNEPETDERPKDVAILIFDDVEVLDFAGPFEVFSVAGHTEGLDLFDVWTVAEHARPVTARNGLSVNARYTFADCPTPGIVVVPGGYGTRRELGNDVVIDWIKDHSTRAGLVLSVCTGALLLAKAGLLEGLSATTHHSAFDLLEELAPNTRIRRGERVVDNGRVVVAAGVSAGIDMALHVVDKLHGTELARSTARYMEYDWTYPARRPPEERSER